MALRTNDSSDFIISAISGPNYNAFYSILGWVYVESLPIGIGRLVWVQGNGDRDAITLQTSGSGFTAGADNNADGTLSAPVELAFNQWHHFAMIRSSPTLQSVYWNFNLISSGTGNVGTARSAPDFTGIFADSGMILRTAGRLFNVTIVERALSVNEIITFSKMYRVYNPRNLWAHYPFLLTGNPGRYKDFSGNERHLAQISAGSPFFDTDAPFTPWGVPPQLVGRRISATGGGEPPATPTYRDIYVLKRVSEDNRVHYKQIVKR